MIAAALALSSALVPHAGLRLDLAPAASRADVSMNFFKNLAAATAPDRGVGAEGGKQLKKVRPEPPLRRPHIYPYFHDFEFLLFRRREVINSSF